MGRWSRKNVICFAILFGLASAAPPSLSDFFGSPQSGPEEVTYTETPPPPPPTPYASAGKRQGDLNALLNSLPGQGPPGPPQFQSNQGPNPNLNLLLNQLGGGPGPQLANANLNNLLNQLGGGPNGNQQLNNLINQLQGGNQPPPPPPPPGPNAGLANLLNQLGGQTSAADLQALLAQLQQDDLSIANPPEDPDIITDVTLNCRVKEDADANTPADCRQKQILTADGLSPRGVCRYDLIKEKCLCPRVTKDVCEEDSQCYWLDKGGSGKCIHNTERLYNALYEKLVLRGKKDLAIQVFYESKPASVKLPYGLYGPHVVGAFQQLQGLYTKHKGYASPGYGYGYGHGHGYGQGYGYPSYGYGQSYGGYGGNHYGHGQGYGYGQTGYGYGQDSYGYGQDSYGKNSYGQDYGYSQGYSGGYGQTGYGGSYGSGDYGTGNGYNSYGSGNDYNSYGTGNDYNSYGTGNDYTSYGAGNDYNSYRTGNDYNSYGTGSDYNSYGNGYSDPYKTGHSSYSDQSYDSGYGSGSSGYGSGSSGYGSGPYGQEERYGQHSYGGYSSGYNQYQNPYTNYGYQNSH